MRKPCRIRDSFFRSYHLHSGRVIVEVKDACLCAHSGIEQKALHSSTATSSYGYVPKGNIQLVIASSAQVQKASNYVLNKKVQLPAFDIIHSQSPRLPKRQSGASKENGNAELEGHTKTKHDLVSVIFLTVQLDSTVFNFAVSHHQETIAKVNGYSIIEGIGATYADLTSKDFLRLAYRVGNTREGKSSLGLYKSHTETSGVKLFHSVMSQYTLASSV